MLSLFFYYWQLPISEKNKNLNLKIMQINYKYIAVGILVGYLVPYIYELSAKSSTLPKFKVKKEEAYFDASDTEEN